MGDVMGGRRVVVAPWGDPFGWRPAVYRLVEDGEEFVREGSTSLVCLVEAFNPDVVILVVPETLLCLRGASGVL